MFKEGKRLTLLWVLIFLLIALAGCASANTTSSSEENSFTLVEQPASLGKEIELVNDETEIEATEGKIEEVETIIEEKTKEKQQSESQAERPQENNPEQKQESKPEQQPSTANISETETEKATVSLAIIGPQGEDYIILDKTEVEWQDGDTVLEVIKRVTRLENIHLEYRGRNKTAYIEGIDNLYEFDRGPLSGWVYRVNGVFPSNSAGAYSLEKGDFIEWLYTLDLGKDVGGHMQGAQGQ